MIAHPDAPRKWLNMSPVEYHATPGLSSSMLRCFVQQGQLEFWARHVGKMKTIKDTGEMRLGRAFHAAMQDESRWRGEFILLADTVPDAALVEQINREMDEAKSKAERLRPGETWNMKYPSHREYHTRVKMFAEKVGKDVLTPADVVKVERQIQAVYDNVACKELVGDKDNTNVEMACFCPEPKLPWPLKALCDLVHPRVIVDFKTTSEGHPHDFIRDAIYRRKYDYQLAYYCLVTGRRRARIISVTSEAPFEAHCFRIPKARLRVLMDEQRKHIEHLIHLYSCGVFDTEVDSQGIPVTWHSEGFNSVMPLDLRYAEGVHFEGDDSDDD